MAHWSEKYLGQKWSESCDCYGWFCKIQAEEFGRDLTTVPIKHKMPLIATTRLMTSGVEDKFGWSPTTDPKDGDMAFLSQRRLPHHIGIVAIVDGAISIIHALDGVGVVRSTLSNLRTFGWRVTGYWQWRS